MRVAAQMDMDFLGPDGGRLAMAFAAGCVAAFSFFSLIGGFFWKVMGRTRLDRIGQLETDLKSEQVRCAEMEARLVSRIEQLETILLFEAVGNVRQGAAVAIAELRSAVEKRLNEATGDDQGERPPRPRDDF